MCPQPLLYVAHIVDSAPTDSAPADSAPQAQLIHDRNTASHGSSHDLPNAKSDATPDRVHMTWTKEKMFSERNRNREANVGVRDLFNMKP